jgi:hypothetical protein
MRCPCGPGSRSASKSRRMAVSNDDILYRRVLASDNHVSVDGPDRTPRISSQAFNDRERKPSVDLARLCGPTGAAWTQEGEENGVLRLITGEVRAEPVVGEMKAAAPPAGAAKSVKVEHQIDVHECPVKDVEGHRDNPAHAEIRPSPEWCSKNVFRRLLERLARIAKVEIFPGPVR